MSPEERVIKFLQSCDPLTRLIDDRIYPLRLPAKSDKVIPALTYFTVSIVPIGSGGCNMVRLQLSAWARRQEEIVLIRDIIIVALSTDPAFTFSTVAQTYEDEAQLFQQPIDILFNHDQNFVKV